MLIQSMTGVASLELLERATLGRVACTHEGQPYITPMSVTYDGVDAPSRRHQVVPGW